MKKITIKNKRYIRGMINNQVANAIRSRNTGDKTTDPKIRKAVLAKTKGLCYICYRKYGTKKQEEYSANTHFSELQIDHIVPFSKGGPNKLSNYMPICGSCNRNKSDKSIGEAKEILQRKRDSKLRNG